MDETNCDIHDLPLLSLISSIQSGQLAAENLTKHYLERIDAWRDLGAVTWSDSGDAITAARAVDAAFASGARLPGLAGIPILVKDNIDVLGYPTTGGTAILRTHQARANARLVSQLRAAGAVVIGKVNMHELAMGGTTNNPSYGRTRNPYNLEHVPGGSSGGSGAAVAARLAPISLGSDTAGSVRIPAFSCGVAGWRPSVFSRTDKVISDEGLIPLARDLDTIGFLTRTIADIIIVREALTGTTIGVGSQRLRLGIPIRYFLDQLEASVADAWESCLATLRAAGVELVDIDMSTIVEIASPGLFQLINAGIREDIPAFLAAQTPAISVDQLIEGLVAPDVINLTKGAQSTPVNRHDEETTRTRRRAWAISMYRELFLAHRLDGVLFPTCPLLPPRHHPGLDPSDIELSLIRYTLIGSFLGAPCANVPATLVSAGLPFGVELDGLPGGDDHLLWTARTVESIFGHLPPPELDAFRRNNLRTSREK
jgi:indoleacetamide hydrolase